MEGKACVPWNGCTTALAPRVIALQNRMHLSQLPCRLKPQRLPHAPRVIAGTTVNCAHINMRMESILQTALAQTGNKVTRTRQPTKRATNLSLSAAVLDDAKSLNLNVSQICDLHLREVVRREQAQRWRQEHADFVAAYNATLEAEGLPLDEWKTF